MGRTPEELAHIEWLGYVQPVGLVVSVPALLAAQAHVNRNIIPDHQRFLACLPHDGEAPVPALEDLGQFARTVLGWRDADLEPVAPGDAEYRTLEVALPEYNETLRATHVVRELEPKDNSHPWMLLVQVLSKGTALDAIPKDNDRHWVATPQAKLERLLRETQVPIGILANGEQIRLVYAPRGESSGYATFNIAEMVQVAGRPIFAALHMLLCEERLFSLGEKQRLPAILADSRKYQNHVSNELAQQVLAALYELLRGFQAADEATQGELLRAVLAENPNHVYQGLLTVLMRLVFVLFAEDRDLLSSDPVYGNHYSVAGLFGRLREDAGRYSDTMNQRFGAWAQLLTLFRLVYDGGSHGGLKIPARRGYLFDPDRYNFLEGRHWKQGRNDRSTPSCRESEADGDSNTRLPRVSDGVIFRVLTNLLILDGERLSYRTLDVEQIGSVYETMMGFELQVAGGRSIAVKPKKSHGAPTTINLEEFLAAKPAERNKWLKANTDQEVSGLAATALKDAATVEDLLAALDRRIAKNVTSNVVAKGAMVFQPSDERRRSGSHYTPRSLTEPIVRTALRPILEQLAEKPTPDQILGLNVCDPAMGSGAFLVEVCRQLGDELVKSWHVHQCVPKLPPDEDELLHARRLIAQQCLYGVDKNPMAVDLSKLSLWLATLAKDHPFTFLDHSLRCGDSLVGLSREQIAAFHWQPPAKRAKDDVWFGDPIAERMKTVTEYRQRILAAGDNKPYEQLRQELDLADDALSLARLTGDSVIAAYFSATKDKQRKQRLGELARELVKYIGPQSRIEDRQPLAEAVKSLLGGDHPLQPIHWQIEFPEVFSEANPGFDALIGNPPFLGGAKIWPVLGGEYCDYIRTIHPKSGGKAVDLVAHFFRRAFCLLRKDGVLSLIATNTVSEGDTREAGLKYICMNGGQIFEALRRYNWPGAVSVVVSIVSIKNGPFGESKLLDGKRVEAINSHLFPSDQEFAPVALASNSGRSFTGTFVHGMGFTFDDTDSSGVATSLSTMNELIKKNPRNAERIRPFIGGSEINSSPSHAYHRYIINFADLTFEEASQWPDLLAIVTNNVKPERDKIGGYSVAERRSNYWWQYGTYTPALYNAISTKDRVLVASKQAYVYFAVASVPSNCIFAHSLVVFDVQTSSGFCAIQSRVHEIWARFFSGTALRLSRYNPSDCFVTFPFPLEWEGQPQMEAAGQAYLDLRTSVMIGNQEGLTETYHRVNDPHETSPDILQLRELHAAMDRAVLEAYGWHDLAQTATCEFLLDFEEEEDDDSSSGKKAKKKKPWRYRWPDEFRDEVLARLLALNKERAEQERLAGAEGKESSKGKKRSATKPKVSDKQNSQTEMF